MFNFAMLNDPDFEAFIKYYDLEPFVSLQRTCEVCNFSRPTLYVMHKKEKLIIRDIAGKRGVFATEIYALFKDAPPAEGRKRAVQKTAAV